MIDAARHRRRGISLALGLAWLFALAVAVLVLRALGRGALSTPPVGSLDQLQAWFDDRDTPTAAFAMIRLGASVAAWYLVTVTLFGWFARIVRSPGLLRLSDAATLPSVRRLLASVAGVSLSASTAALVGPTLPLLVRHLPVSAAMAEGADGNDDRDRIVIMRRIAPPHDDDDTATMRVIAQPPAPKPPPAAKPPPTRERPPVQSSTVWRVVAGESFWSAAQQTLAGAWHRSPTDREVVNYWHALIEHNRSRLADPANPDLIYPGQSFDLPPPPPAP